jgi:hypothetical protein
MVHLTSHYYITLHAWMDVVIVHYLEASWKVDAIIMPTHANLPLTTVKKRTFDNNVLKISQSLAGIRTALSVYGQLEIIFAETGSLSISTSDR